VRTNGGLFTYCFWYHYNSVYIVLSFCRKWPKSFTAVSQPSDCHLFFPSATISIIRVVLPAATSTVLFLLRVFGSSQSKTRIGFFLLAATSTELNYFVYSTVQKHCRTFCSLLCHICFMPVSGSPPTSLPSYSDKYVTLMWLNFSLDHDALCI